MSAILPYKGKDFSLRVKGYWELGEINIALTKEGKLLKEIGIPVHVLEEVMAAMLREKEAILAMDREFEAHCKGLEARSVVESTQWGPL